MKVSNLEPLTVKANPGLEKMALYYAMSVDQSFVLFCQEKTNRLWSEVIDTAKPSDLMQ